LSRPLKKVLFFSAAALVGLAILAAMALFVFVDVDGHKPRLETTASKMLGVEVKIGGHLGIGLFPGLRVSMEDVQIGNRGGEVFSAKLATLGIDILPLLSKQVRVRTLALEHPRFAIERSLDGQINVLEPATPGRTLPALDVAGISFSDGSFLYTNKQTGDVIEAGACSLDLQRLQRPGGEARDVLKKLSFNAEIACAKIRRNEFRATELKVSAGADNGVMNFTPVTMRAFGGQGAGKLRADFSGTDPQYQLRYSLSQFHIHEFLATQSPGIVARGSLDFSLNLSMRGKIAEELTMSANGDATLRGKNLAIEGADLDLVLSRFESSQNFNIVDLGAFLFAGPAGLVVMKGYNFASIFQKTGGRSEIRTLVSEWKVERGVAQAQDVALATNKNRIALQGELDFVNQKFKDVTVAVVDARGCVKLHQAIRGSFRKPAVDKLNVLTSLAGPVLNVLKKGTDLVPGEKCEVFYAGSVAPPQ
jgi:uncharacterized protein involved in outer membrane biogenesis